mmetsp:Transcript_42242/g.63780  ORF Transcript_42242/g.63780 Transcript_42242/m.63780 type:complete len:85 (-) Transcript_42242:122-376(-)
MFQLNWGNKSTSGLPLAYQQAIYMLRIWERKINCNVLAPFWFRCFYVLFVLVAALQLNSINTKFPKILFSFGKLNVWKKVLRSW